MAAFAKRKVDSLDEMDSPRKKKKSWIPEAESSENPAMEDDFTVVHFKFMLREDQTSAIKGLEKFIEVSSNDDYDIIKEYVTSSLECEEIFALLDKHEKQMLKPNELALVFQAFEKILLQIAGQEELEEYFTVGKRIVTKLLTIYMSKIMFTLNMKGKSSHIKATLKLLTAMVMLSSLTATLVLNNMNFGDPKMTSLFERRDIQDKEDVRTCFIHLIVAFLLSEDNQVIRKLVDTRDFIDQAFYGLTYDRMAVVQLLLSTVLEKVVMNSSVSKTSKVHLFHGRVLSSLGNLFKWKGPTRRKDKSTKEPTEVLAESSISEMTECVFEIAHHFLIELCTTYSHGIIFKDMTFGRSGRNNNQIVTNFLVNLTSSHKHPLVTDLVVKSLSACPVIIQFFVPTIGKKLEPQINKTWVDCMDLVYKIYKSLPTEPPILHMKEQITVEETVDILLLYTCPPLQFKSAVLPGFKKKSFILNHVLLKTMLVFAERTVKILAFIDKVDETSSSQLKWSPEDRRELTALYKKSVLQSIPEPKVIYDCLDVVLKARKEEQLKELKVLTGSEESDLDVIMIQTFTAYQELFPSILVDNHLVLAKLIDRVIQQHSGDNHLPQVYLLNLLAGTDARRLPWGKQNKQGRTLVHQLLEMVSRLSSIDSVKDVCLRLICKLLLKTGLFDGFDDELPVWIRPLQSQKGSSEDNTSLLDYVSGVLTSYMSNPYPHMDKMSDLMSEVALMKSDGREGSVMDDEEKFKAVVAMEIDDLDSDEEDNSTQTNQTVLSAVKRFPFCPMLLVAQESIKNKEDQDVKSYLSQVVLDVFHQQVDPVPMCVQLQRWTSEDLLDGVQTYILTWLDPTAGKDSKETPKKKKKNDSSHEPLTVQRYGELVRVNTVLKQDEGNHVDNVRQQLLHLVYILGQSEPNDDATVKVQSVVQNLQEIIENTISVDNEKMETSSKTELPVLLTDARVPVSTSCVQTVLTHPILMENFFRENVESQSKKNLSEVQKILTDMVIYILEIVNDKSLTVAGDIIEIYNEKVLRVLKEVCMFSDNQQQEVLPLIYRYLKFMVQNMDTERCAEVLNHVLSVSITGTKKEVCEVLVSLMVKLKTSTIRIIRLNEANVGRLISWCLETDTTELTECLVNFFQTFPTLSVLCPDALFGMVFNADGCNELVTVLIQNNSRLQTLLEDKLETGKEVKVLTHLPVIFEFLKVKFARRSEGDTKVPEVVVAVRKLMDPLFEQLAGLDNTEDVTTVFEIFQFLLKMEVFDKDTVRRLETKVLDSLRHQDTSILQPHHVKMADQLLHSPLSEHDTNVSHRLLRVALEGLTNLFTKRKHQNDAMEAEFLDLLAKISQEEMQNFPSTWSEFTEAWPVLVNRTLKYLYTNPKLLTFLAKFVSIVYADPDTDVGITIETIVTMVTDHSSFLPVMFNEETEECKGGVVDLLSELLHLSPTCCLSEHIVIYFGAYGATLSLTDQKILKLLHFYENQGIDFNAFRPYIWGEKAIEFQMLHPKDKVTLLRMKMGKVLDCIEVERMQQTILNFPLTLRLQHTNVIEAEKCRGVSTSYDPCFFMSLFSFLLAPDRYVDCMKFVEYDCLGLVFASLSSHDKTLRSAAYHVLDRFQVHLQELRFQGHDDVAYLLTLLRNSLTEPVCKLAPLIAIFLAKAAKLIFQPGNHMYTVIKSFLLAKPTLDIFDIPEFYKLFNSSDLEHKTERGWILSLMQEGLREIADFRIFEKRYSFKVLFSFYDTETADADSQIKILQIVKLACKDRTMTVSLCNEHGILTWIGTTIAKLSPGKKRHITELVGILNALWFTMLGKIENSAEKTGHLEPIFTSHLLNLSQAILWYLRDVDKTVVQLHLKTLLSVVKHQNLVVSQFRKGETTPAPSSLTYADLLILLIYVQRFQNTESAVKPILNILSSIGYNTSMLQINRGSHSKHRHSVKVREVIEESIPGADNKDESEKVEGSQTNAENDVENSEEKAEEKLEEDISRSLLTLILNENCLEGQSGRVELVAASMVLVGWVVDRLEKGHHSDMMLDGIAFINRIWTRNPALARTICSLSNKGSNIITGLLNLYSVAHSKHVKLYHKCIHTLNTLLTDAADKMFGKDISGMTTGGAEEVSLTLRQIFVTDSTSWVVNDTEKLTETLKTKEGKKHKKRKSITTETDSPKRKKKQEKPVSKELTGVSQIVENLHLQPEGGHDDDDVDDDLKMEKFSGKKRQVTLKDQLASPSKKMKTDSPRKSKKSLM